MRWEKDTISVRTTNGVRAKCEDFKLHTSDPLQDLLPQIDMEVQADSINIDIEKGSEIEKMSVEVRSGQSFVPPAAEEGALRSGMISKVTEMLNSRRRNLTDYHIEEHNTAAKSIEECLYSTASTQENYLDEGSLPYRVDCILEQLQNEPSIVRLQADVEPQPAPFTQRVREAQKKMISSPVSGLQQKKRKFVPVEFETHSAERNRVLEGIVDILQTRRPNGTVNWHVALPHLHRRLEECLYRQDCHALEKYTDMNTLSERVSDFVTLGGQKKPFQVRSLKSVPLPEHLLQSSRDVAKHPAKKTTPKKAAFTTPAKPSVTGASKATEPSGTSNSSSAVKSGEGTAKKKAKTPDELLLKQQQRLLLLQHAAQCTAPLGECRATQHCADMRALWSHITSCQVPKCSTPHCISSRYVLSHFCNCNDPACRMCQPVRENRGLDALSGTEDNNSESGAVDRGGKRKCLVEGAGGDEENVLNEAQSRRRLSTESGRSAQTVSTAATAVSGHSSSFASRAMSKHITELFTPVLEQLLEVPYAQAYFGAPVDPVASGAPNYFAVIKRPMDLGTVLRRLHSFSYTHVQQLVDDVELVFSNAHAYNRPGTVVYNLAKRLKSLFSWAARKPRMDLSQKLAQLEGGGAGVAVDVRTGPGTAPMQVRRHTSSSTASTAGREDSEQEVSPRPAVEQEA
jgi:hypothetical protein